MRGRHSTVNAITVLPNHGDPEKNRENPRISPGFFLKFAEGRSVDSLDLADSGQSIEGSVGFGLVWRHIELIRRQCKGPSSLAEDSE